MQTNYSVAQQGDVLAGTVRWSPVSSLWWTAMTMSTLVGGFATFS